MSDKTPMLGFTKMTANQSGAEVIYNEMLIRLDRLLTTAVRDSSPSTTPPTSPAEGDAYIVPPEATGDWAEKDGQIAVYSSGWIFIKPREGMRVWDALNNKRMIYVGSWVEGTAAAMSDLSEFVAVSSFEEVDTALSSLVSSFNTLLQNLREGHVIKGVALTDKQVEETVQISESVVVKLNP